MPIASPPAGRDAFADPATGLVYVWHRNHDEEQAGARIRTINNLQPTKGRWQTIRAIRTQGGRDELVYKLAGKIPVIAQHQEFLFWMQLSLSQTIYFFHAAGEKFECQLSDYEPQRNYRAGPYTENYLWNYSMQLDVIQVLP